ncbi:MAG: alkaline phosphatase family protein [Pseudomonadota bacterium]
MFDTITTSSKPVDRWLRPRFESDSIVNLMSSISAGLGVVNNAYPPLALLPPRQVAQARNVVLFVVDGLGYQYLRQRQANSKLARHLIGTLTSVFPSTTATAITSFVTGVAPLQHGVTGWYTYLQDADRVCAVLPFRVRGADAAIDARSASNILWARPLFERFAAKSVVVMPEHIANSPYTLLTTGAVKRVPFQNLQSCVQNIFEAVQGGEYRTFVYAYWPQLDTLCHEHGVNSAQAERHFQEIDRAFAYLVEALLGTDTLLLVTADHGLVDSTPQHKVVFNDHPDLMAMLRYPLSGEPRAAYCHVKPGMHAAFKRYVETQLTESVALFESSVLLEKGYFGIGPPSAEFIARIGDYVLIMRDNWVIKDYMPGEKPFTQIGVHGGLTEDELLVPLIKVRL